MIKSSSSQYKPWFVKEDEEILWQKEYPSRNLVVEKYIYYVLLDIAILVLMGNLIAILLIKGTQELSILSTIMGIFFFLFILIEIMAKYHTMNKYVPNQEIRQYKAISIITNKNIYDKSFGNLQLRPDLVQTLELEYNNDVVRLQIANIKLLQIIPIKNYFQIQFITQIPKQKDHKTVCELLPLSKEELSKIMEILDSLLKLELETHTKEYDTYKNVNYQEKNI